MAIDIDKMFTVNKESLKHSLDILIDQRLNFRPLSREKLIELIKIDMNEIPFDGTIIERNEFIEETLNDLIENYIDNKKLVLENVDFFVKVDNEENLINAINNLEEDQIIKLNENVDITKTLTVNQNNVTIDLNNNNVNAPIVITSENVIVKNAKTKDVITVKGKNVTLNNIIFAEYNSNVTEGKGNGKKLLEVITDGNITIKNCNISNITGKLYNAFNINAKGKVVIEGNVFDTTEDIYNVIEFNQTTPVKTGTIIKNNVFKKSKNNSISMFVVEDNANINIENNVFEYSANAMRLSNYTNKSATFNITNNNILDGETNQYGGFICFQAVHENETFKDYKINVTNLIGTNGKITTVEGDGTDNINRLGYYFGNKYENNIMPNEAKAKVKFL